MFGPSSDQVMLRLRQDWPRSNPLKKIQSRLNWESWVGS